MSYRKRKKSKWCKEALKALIDRDMNVSDLAVELGIGREYVSGIVNGRTIVPDMAQLIGDYLGITVPYLE